VIFTKILQYFKVSSKRCTFSLRDPGGDDGSGMYHRPFLRRIRIKEKIMLNPKLTLPPASPPTTEHTTPTLFTNSVFIRTTRGILTPFK
jgi:hypothetical protein